MPAKRRESLDVFLSSDQREFLRERRELARRISAFPDFDCTPLEARGAASDDVTAVSLKAVRDSQVFVGIFGSEYSETTIREYREARRRGRETFIYVKNPDNRDPRLRRFIDNELKNQVKYDSFSSSRELYRKVVQRIDAFRRELVRRGFESLQESKSYALQYETGLRQQAKVVRGMTIKRPPSLMRDAEQLLERAEQQYASRQYLEALISSWTAIEIALRTSLSRIPGRRPTISQNVGQIIGTSRELGIISAKQLQRLRQVSYARNAAVHGAQRPTRQDVHSALDVARHLIAGLMK